MQRSVVKVENVSKAYADQIALQSINLDIINGEFLTLLGPSGCGKTTLLRLIAGFVNPNQGKILIQGKDVTEVPPEKRYVNMVFQSYALFPHLNVFDNVAFGLKCQKIPAHEIKVRVSAVLNRVKLEAFALRKPHELSGGQQQRVAIARAIVNEPLVLLLDEPLSALDYHLRRNMRIELKALQRRLGITFVLVTHDQEEALMLSDRIAVMNHGKIEQVGTPRDIYEEPANLHVAGFIGEANIFKSIVTYADQQIIKANIADKSFEFKNKRHFKVGDRVNIIIRPEDITVWGVDETDPRSLNLVAGTVSEVIYKGSTVDLIVEFANGQKISATAFFDEDDENLDYKINDKVLVEWQHGWEVVLPDEP